MGDISNDFTGPLEGLKVMKLIKHLGQCRCLSVVERSDHTLLYPCRDEFESENARRVGINSGQLRHDHSTVRPLATRGTPVVVISGHPRL